MNLHRQISAITHIKLICQKYKVLTPLDFLGVDIHALLTKGGDLRLARGKAPNLFSATRPKRPITPAVRWLTVLPTPLTYYYQG